MTVEFVRPSSVDEAVALGKAGYVFLAGGTQVNNAPFRTWGKPVDRVASLDRLDLGGIRSIDGSVEVGAGTTLQEIADSARLPEALRNAAGFIPTRSVRNIATVGGNVGANRPDSYVIPALVALGAEAVLAGPNETIPVERYVADEREDLILSFRIPDVVGACHAVKESRSHLALPVVSAAVRLAVSGGLIDEAVVVAGCAGPHTRRLSGVERRLIGTAARDGGPLDGDELEASIAAEVEPTADILGSAEFKRYVNGVVIADLVRRCAREVLS